jgi:hypothetical protein
MCAGVLPDRSAARFLAVLREMRAIGRSNMLSNRQVLSACASAAVLSFAVACGAPPEAKAPEAPPIVAPATEPPPLPTVDVTPIQTTLGTDYTIETLTFDRNGSTTVEGAITGYQSKAWAIPVAAGQTLTVTFQPSNTNLYMNVRDAAVMTGDAVFIGETGGPNAVITAEHDGVYVVQPYQPRAMARRNETGNYTLIVSRS